jgi:DNA-directed RNA polymerase alpha subunit
MVTKSEFQLLRVNKVDWDNGRNTRIQNALLNEGILTVAELMRFTESELLRTPNFGQKSLVAIKNVLAQHGLKLESGYS